MLVLIIKPKIPITKKRIEFQKFKPYFLFVLKGLLPDPLRGMDSEQGSSVLFFEILTINSISARAMIKRENIRIGTFKIIRKQKTRIGYIANTALNNRLKILLYLSLILPIEFHFDSLAFSINSAKASTEAKSFLFSSVLSAENLMPNFFLNAIPNSKASIESRPKPSPKSGSESTISPGLIS